MTTPTFKPVFGPNGAVMNAPSVTPEMREKLERAARPPTARELMRDFIAAAPYLLVGLVIIAGGPSAYYFLKSSPWWAGAVAGAVATIILIFAWRTVVRNFTRWELRPSQKSSRRLRMPDWARWALAVAESLTVAAYAALLIGLVSDIERQYAFIWYAIMLPMALFGGAGALLRWYAGERKWTSQAEIA